MKQLTASGVLDSIKIHASGYEHRENMEHFVDKYWPLSLQFKTKSTTSNSTIPSLEDYVSKIFAAVSKDDESNPCHFFQRQWAIGVTQVFMKGPCKKAVQ